MSINNVLNKIFCFFLCHDWTCRAAEGEEPTKTEIEAGISGFYQYAQMYCKRCGHIYKP